jgi:hypothetical protein
MAKVKLELGAEFDLLNKDELTHALTGQSAWQRAAAEGMRHIDIPLLQGTPSGGALTLGAQAIPAQWCGPRSGFVWRLERITVSGLTPGDTLTLYKDALPVADITAPTGDLVEQAAATSFTAGATASAYLTGATYLTGFDVTTAAAGSGSPAGTVTVQGMTYAAPTYDIAESSTAATILSIRYPGPGLQVSPGNNPGVTISAISGGAAGHINVYGMVPQSPAVATYHPGGRAVVLKGGDLLSLAGTNLQTAGLVQVTGQATQVPGPMIWKIL